MNWQLFGLALIPLVAIGLGKLTIIAINYLDSPKAATTAQPNFSSFDAFKSRTLEEKIEILSEVKRHLAM